MNTAERKKIQNTLQITNKNYLCQLVLHDLLVLFNAFNQYAILTSIKCNHQGASFYQSLSHEHHQLPVYQERIISKHYWSNNQRAKSRSLSLIRT